MAMRPLNANKTEQAFQDYLRHPVVQKALAMTKDSLTEDLLRDCFMSGAGYAIRHAIARCNAEHHH